MAGAQVWSPHGDFKKVQESRPEFPEASKFRFVRTPKPDWKFGDGANNVDDPGRDAKHIAIDPHGPNRSASANYKLILSAITPRPIALVSTRSADGKSTNMAAFSYFNMINHDPPLMVIGFIGATGRPKDSLQNLLETKECVINIISETFIEAANASSIDAPYGLSEWDVSGLTPEPCEVVKAPRIKEAIFSIEAKLDMVKDWDSRFKPGEVTGTMVVVEGVRIWVREDALNEEQTLVDPAILRPVSRLGGITYLRAAEAFEIPRPNFEKDLGGRDGFEKLKNGTKDAA